MSDGFSKVFDKKRLNVQIAVFRLPLQMGI